MCFFQTIWGKRAKRIRRQQTNCKVVMTNQETQLLLERPCQGRPKEKPLSWSVSSLKVSLFVTFATGHFSVQWHVILLFSFLTEKLISKVLRRRLAFVLWKKPTKDGGSLVGQSVAAQSASSCHFSVYSVLCSSLLLCFFVYYYYYYYFIYIYVFLFVSHSCMFWTVFWKWEHDCLVFDADKCSGFIAECSCPLGVGAQEWTDFLDIYKLIEKIRVVQKGELHF